MNEGKKKQEAKKSIDDTFQKIETLKTNVENLTNEIQAYFNKAESINNPIINADLEMQIEIVKESYETFTKIKNKIDAVLNTVKIMKEHKNPNISKLQEYKKSAADGWTSLIDNKSEIEAQSAVKTAKEALEKALQLAGITTTTISPLSSPRSRSNSPTPTVFFTPPSNDIVKRTLTVPIFAIQEANNFTLFPIQHVLYVTIKKNEQNIVKISNKVVLDADVPTNPIDPAKQKYMLTPNTLLGHDTFYFLVPDDGEPATQLLVSHVECVPYQNKSCLSVIISYLYTNDTKRKKGYAAKLLQGATYSEWTRAPTNFETIRFVLEVDKSDEDNLTKRYTKDGFTKSNLKSTNDQIIMYELVVSNHIPP